MHAQISQYDGEEQVRVQSGLKRGRAVCGIVYAVIVGVDQVCIWTVADFPRQAK